ncbi:secreted RxLR effector protein 161-like [Rutidosis leptorrhynchoides]|uniref:secreted RxLR effector protein 161-like n=1 Tax=Rutidosis leptorrhynchoides TaxID=125765 RepID=UPI003A98E049
MSQLEYSRVIGCLMYAMSSTRPNIGFIVEKLSRFTSNPNATHWRAVVRGFKYLKAMMDYGITYSWFPSVLEGYSDASCITNIEDHSSKTGWIFLLGGALAATDKEAEWLRNLIHEFPLWQKPISPISNCCESEATLAKAYT